MPDPRHTSRPPSGVVASRIHPPLPRHGAIERRHILELVGARRDVATIALVAPAGFAKSTTLRQIAHGDPRPLAWLTLTPAEDDPLALARQLAAATWEFADPAATIGALDTIGATGDAAVKPALVALLELIESQPLGVQLALDDLHRLSAPPSLRLVGELADSLPAGSRILLGTRDPAGMDLPRRVAAGRALVLDTSELRFSAGEAHAAVSATAPSLHPEVVEEICALAEGWPAGLVLAAAATDATGSVVGPGTRLGGFDALAHYLHSEILASLTARERDLLQRCSILEELSGPLCDHVAGTTGSAEVLRAMVSAGNPLVVTVGHVHPSAGESLEWFRLHHLAIDHLRGDLSLMDPEEVRSLHRRAAPWLSSYQLHEPAVGHAIASGDTELIGHTMLAAIGTIIATGSVDTLQRWLAGIEPDDLRAQPGLALCAGWCDLLSGRGGRVPGWLAHADRNAGFTADGAALGLGIDALAMVAAVGGVSETVARADRIVARGPATGLWYGLAVLQGAVGRLAMGALPDRVGTFSRVAFECEGHTATHVVARAHLAHAQLDARDLAAAEETIGTALADMDAAGLREFALVAMVHAVDSLIAAERRDTSRSRAAETTSLEMSGRLSQSIPRAHAQLFLLLGEAALRRGDVDAADRHVDRAVHHLEAEPAATGFAEWAGQLRARVDATGDPVVLAGGVVITPAERRVLDELPTHLSLPEIGERLYVSRNTVKSHAISIYRKLGVSGRSAAVDRARELGLLDP